MQVCMSLPARACHRNKQADLPTPATTSIPERQRDRRYHQPRGQSARGPACIGPGTHGLLLLHPQCRIARTHFTPIPAICLHLDSPPTRPPSSPPTTPRAPSTGWAAV
jgi:hypothetical protein